MLAIGGESRLDENAAWPDQPGQKTAAIDVTDAQHTVLAATQELPPIVTKLRGLYRSTLASQHAAQPPGRGVPQARCAVVARGRQSAPTWAGAGPHHTADVPQQIRLAKRVSPRSAQSLGTDTQLAQRGSFWFCRGITSWEWSRA